MYACMFVGDEMTVFSLLVYAYVCMNVCIYACMTVGDEMTVFSLLVRG
jgi:hypothetical protein